MTVSGDVSPRDSRRFFAGGDLGMWQNPLASVALHPIIAILGFLLSYSPLNLFSHWPNDCDRRPHTFETPIHADLPFLWLTFARGATRFLARPPLAISVLAHRWSNRPWWNSILAGRVSLVLVLFWSSWNAVALSGLFDREQLRSLPALFPAHC